MKKKYDCNDCKQIKRIARENKFEITANVVLELVLVVLGFLIR